MEGKLDQIVKDIGDIKTQQAVTNERLKHYNDSLDKHIKRTEILEGQVAQLWKWKWMVAGGISVLTFLAQFLVKFINT